MWEELAKFWLAKTGIECVLSVVALIALAALVV